MMLSICVMEAKHSLGASARSFSVLLRACKIKDCFVVCRVKRFANVGNGSGCRVKRELLRPYERAFGVSGLELDAAFAKSGAGAGGNSILSACWL